MTNCGQYFWIFPTLLHSWMWRDLSCELVARTGLKPLLIAATEQDLKFWQRQFDDTCVAEIVVHFDYLGYALDGGDESESPERLSERAAAYEKRHGITLMRDMVLGCRHIGRGFVLGGQGHPVSPVSGRVNQRIAVQTCLAIAEYFEVLATQYPPGLMLIGGGGGGVYMKPASLIARRENVPFRTLAHARFADYYLWADSEFEESESFRAFHTRQPIPNDDDVTRAQKNIAPTGLSVIGFSAFRKEIRWLSNIRRIILTYLRYFYGRLRGYRKSRIGVTPGSNARSMLRSWSDTKKLNRIATVRVAELPRHQKIVYFPLQTEPEHSLNVLSPEHTNQLATAVELALSLPANAILAVKEHPYQVGRRTAGFYETLTALPNVLFLHTDEQSIDVIKRADLVAVITSSAGYEAAVLGKPVIHFGRHGQLLDLPHVHCMTGFTGMNCIADLLADDGPVAADQRRRDGARYFLAIEKYAIDMSSFKAHGRKSNPNAIELTQITENLLKTLPNNESHMSTPAKRVSAL